MLDTHNMSVEAASAPFEGGDMDEGIPLVAPWPGVPIQLPRPVPEDIGKKKHEVTHLRPEP